ncbi:circadian clock protein KaiC [Stigmatella aurantiaca]|uniref:non-specific serine/threonine protein kinase n=1 Tax=Stigmatella aurantiaca TaxID=41 RepID=A0A1H7WJ45_STIAU|nr:ATPase domain-containing protein [Stigmatella aurantiaca]SEM21642.1 circadian clock protein KaiC [Stigmatella aurantiaca]
MTDSSARPAERIPTGIPGLDTVLSGGFRTGRTYMVMGLPGAGKTILANQACFHHATQGGRVLYVTLLAESHTELVSNLNSLSFFDASRLPDAISYLSAFNELEQEGLEGLGTLLRKEIRSQRISLLVLDGLVAAEEMAPSPQALKKFIHGLQVVTQLVGCTALVLTTGGGQGLRAEHTMVDGLLILKQRTVGARTIRELLVRKFRGSPHLLGRHSFEITSRGLEVFPRLETVAEVNAPSAHTGEARCAFGIAGLDTMLAGGLPMGSTTILLGPPGSGKTLLGMHFLAEGARKGDRGHYFAFYDAPRRMLAQTASVGLELAPLIDQGLLEVSFRAPTETLLDKLGAQMLEAIRTRGARRIFLDGYDALTKAAVRQSRVARFLAALVNECRVRGVTLLFTVETASAFGPEVKFPTRGISMMAENILFLRSVELHSELRRFISILKERNSGYDGTVRELLINGQGLTVGSSFEDAQMLMTGMARSPAGVPSRKSPRGRRGA